MAGKPHNPADKGRCARCALSFFNKDAGQKGLRWCLGVIAKSIELVSMLDFAESCE